jgi:hypothetical protein
VSITFEIRALGSLPWPNGLGKHEYPVLEHAMKRLLANEYADPAAHEEAFHTNPAYREIAMAELTKASWSSEVIGGALRATELARHSPLLRQPLQYEDPWLAWARAHHSAGYPTYTWLAHPPTVYPIYRRLGGGRHRLTYLRLHLPSEHPILVKTNDSP